MKQNGTMKTNTQLIHAGAQRNAFGAVVEPLYRSSTFGFESVEEAAQRASGIMGGKHDLYAYTRLGNPTNAALERRMAALEHAQDCVVTASGIGAISTVMWTFLARGEHVLADTALYGDTHALLEQALPRFGVAVDFIDFNDLDRVQRSLRANTSMVYFESPCNPTLKVNDIARVSRIAHAHRKGIRVVIDNTFATPYLQNPLTLGADLVVHSMTKYLGGHSDVMGGCICGSEDDLHKVRFEGIDHTTGAVMSPDNAYLVLRGISTLGVRMQRHCDNALKVARHLERSPYVARVHYPGLRDDPGHRIASRQMHAYGGMVAVELKGTFAQTKRFMNSLKLIQRAVSLGGVESLAEHPASMTHASFSPEELKAAGIAQSLVRISVGIEDAQDILDDLDQAFAAMQRGKSRSPHRPAQARPAHPGTQPGRSRSVTHMRRKVATPPSRRPPAVTSRRVVSRPAASPRVVAKPVVTRPIPTRPAVTRTRTVMTRPASRTTQRRPLTRMP